VGARRAGDASSRVIARSTVVVEAGGVLGELSCQPPLTIRRVGNDDAGLCDLRLVGTSAGPLPGDDLELAIEVRECARARLEATGASIAQGRSSHEASSLRIRADLADGSRLSAAPGALVVCAGSRVDVSITIALRASATLDWRESIVLGRSDEAPGSATLRWDVTRDGRPILRQLIDLRSAALTGWAGMIARRRVLASALLVSPALTARTVVASSTAAAQRIDDHAVLITVLAPDAAAASQQLQALCASVGG
jgi:urease accessory protein